MKPVEFVGQTLVLKPPAGHDNATAATKVGGLPVLLMCDGDGYAQIVSCWKPSPEELAQLAAGAVIRLVVMSAAMPPVWVDVAEAEILP